jgi:predicted transcriptional regulator
MIYGNTRGKKMLKPGPFISAIAVVGLFALSASWASSIQVGASAPFFSVKSGDDKVLTLDMLQGKVVSLMYETREMVEKNRPLKNALKEFFHQQPNSVNEQISRLPVINCSSASWPIIKLWRHKLKENSKKEGLTIYGDWDGKMLGDYGMQDNESNYIIIDKQGIVRYFASGKIEDNEIQNILALLTALIEEN